MGWGRISGIGGRIALPQAGVSLTVPSGAIDKGHQEDMYIAVLTEDKDRPKLKGNSNYREPQIQEWAVNVK